MLGLTLGLLGEAASSDKQNLYPHAPELIVGALAFAIIFVFMWKWVIPRMNTLLDERREKIQGEMEKAEQESQAIVGRAQEEIRAERDRVFQELRTQVGELVVRLAGKVVEKELDTSTHARLIDEYIEQVASGGNGKS